MRFRPWALLGILLVLIFCLSVDRDYLLGRSTQIDDAQSKLVQAFVLVQQADLEGASPEQISLLADNLNLALSYEDNASKSVSLSNAISTQALSLATAARTQKFFDQAAAYSIAAAVGFGSALLVLEIHRVDNLVRRIRLRRMRLD